ncbi:SBF-like CPA transporter family-domain-containing protein [Phascolomyces articulosus]|uniref:SBF-like CPA transporter family-domain-containing protein n=1 Tax=Phascolomyces articulosus TaxID=60185 RepID=A0AAD5K671_9FUNG|nr:SBF-like CPA transporter family-domain-containing protein [Phascolomyces articulosus]
MATTTSTVVATTANTSRNDNDSSIQSETVISLQGQHDTPSIPDDKENKEPTTTILQPQHEQPKKLWRRILDRVIHYLKQYWFLLGLGTVIGLAWAFPQVGKTNGVIEAQYTVKWGAVIVIFLLSGLGLEVKVMLQTILRWRLHLVVQIINFVFMPFFAFGVVHFLIKVGAKLDMAVYQGFMIAFSTSTTVSSNAVMTRNAHGNDSGALVNAALGNILGIFVSPALMQLFGDDNRIFTPGTRGTVDFLSVLKTLGLTVLLPLVVGQVIRYFFTRKVKYLAAKLHFSIINSLALLCMVWSVFCDGVASDAFHRMSGVDIIAIIGVDIFMYLLGCSFCIFVARVPWPSKLLSTPTPALVKKWRFSRQDAVAIMYCGATKTVSLGIPLINVLYSDKSLGMMGVLSLPLLMYHIIQLFIGNFQVPFLKRWIEKTLEDVDEDEQIPMSNTSSNISTTDHTHREGEDNISLPTTTRRRTAQA